MPNYILALSFLVMNVIIVLAFKVKGKCCYRALDAVAK